MQEISSVISHQVCTFDVITSIKTMESMECMYVTLLRFALPYVTFCGIHRNIMYEGQTTSNASYFFFSFTFQENSNTITYYYLLLRNVQQDIMEIENNPTTTNILYLCNPCSSHPSWSVVITPTISTYVHVTLQSQQSIFPCSYAAAVRVMDDIRYA